MSERPRILQVFNQYLEKGGEEASVMRIFELLQEQFAVDRCTFSSEDWRGPHAPPAWKQAGLIFHNPDSIQRLREAHVRHRADAWLVHNVFPVGSASVYREALRLQAPVIYYIHNFRPFSVNSYLWDGSRLAPGGLRKNYWQEIRAGAWQNSRLKTAWFALVLQTMHRLGWFRAIRAWVAISDFMRDRFIEAGVPAQDVFTVPHFWHVVETPPLRDDGYFLFLGRLIHAKGVDVLFDAWAEVRRELGAKAPRLVIAGAGPLAEHVQRRCGENEKVEFAGLVQGQVKSELIAGCSAMIAPSLWWEPLGLVTYEAYNYEKPMLAARSGGLTETVEHGKTGLLHEPGNSNELARQVMEIHAAPAQRREEMGRAGKQWLLEHTHQQLWLDRFQEVLAHALRPR